MMLRLVHWRWWWHTCKGAVILVEGEPIEGFAGMPDGLEDAGIAGMHAEGLQDVQLKVADGAAATDCHWGPSLPGPL